VTNENFSSNEETVYVIIRNPHTQGVANVQEASIVRHPEDPEKQSLYLYDMHYPLTDDVAVYRSAFEADCAFREAFGLIDVENFHG